MIEDDGILMNATDQFTELLAEEKFSDFEDYLIHERLLVEAYPESSRERIRVEREF